jgi:hypothetical protein
MFKRVPVETKREVLEKIKNGMSVSYIPGFLIKPD